MTEKKHKQTREKKNGIKIKCKLSLPRMVPLENVDVYQFEAFHLSGMILKEVNDHDYAHFLFLIVCTYVL